MLLKVDCLPNAVGKQPSIPLIYLGRKWTLNWWWWWWWWWWYICLWNWHLLKVGLNMKLIKVTEENLLQSCRVIWLISLVRSPYFSISLWYQLAPWSNSIWSSSTMVETPYRKLVCWADMACTFEFVLHFVRCVSFLTVSAKQIVFII